MAKQVADTGVWAQRSERMAMPTSHYASTDELKQHLHMFLPAYDCSRRQETLKARTPDELICQQWTVEPERYKLDAHHHDPGLNT